MNKKKTVLVTGCAGFIGMHISLKLLKKKFNVIGVDNINDYYDVNIKKARVKILSKNKKFKFFKKDLRNKNSLELIYKKYSFKKIVHLAAQAGVRYSIENPKNYIENNIDAFLNILEFCKKNKIKHLIYASSSSVYGINKKFPFSEQDGVNHPISMYAVTKKTNELMAHTYSKLFNLPTTGIRFFTVYGPYGRPDMALFKFTKNILENKAIQVFNKGEMYRDFTFIDDTVDALYKIIIKKPSEDVSFNSFKPKPNISSCKYRIFNIGNNKSIKLNKFIELLEKEIKIKAKKKYLNMQMGDVKSTVASNKILKKWINQKNGTPHEIGIKKFVEWYFEYFKIYT
jgi:UDP-glucuronate 4-epimerase